MVYGRHRTRNGRRVPVAAGQWLWSPAPVHPPIIDRDTWDQAQTVAARPDQPEPIWDLGNTPRTVRMPHPPVGRWGRRGW
jgi:hypothetical protein